MEWVVRGTRLPPDPAVVTALIATSGDLVRSASEAVARAQRVREQSRELIAAGRRAEADRPHGSPEGPPPSHARSGSDHLQHHALESGQVARRDEGI